MLFSSCPDSVPEGSTCWQQCTAQQPLPMGSISTRRRLQHLMQLLSRTLISKIFVVPIILQRVAFYYHSVLDSIYGLLQECGNDERMAVGWVREGQSVSSGALMMIRIIVVLKLFRTFWTYNSTYRVRCLQCANGFWSTEKVEQELFPFIERRLHIEIVVDKEKIDHGNSNQQHHWPWKVLDKNEIKKFGQQTPRRWGWGTPLKKRAATRINLM